MDPFDPQRLENEKRKLRMLERLTREYPDDDDNPLAPLLPPKTSRVLNGLVTAWYVLQVVGIIALLLGLAYLISQLRT